MRIYSLSVRAEDRRAGLAAIKKMADGLTDDNADYNLKEQDEPIDWHEQAKSQATDIFVYDVKPSFDEVYQTKLAEYRDKFNQLFNDDKDFAEQWNNTDKDFMEWLDNTGAGEDLMAKVYDELDEKIDLHNMAHKAGDGRFIHNSLDAIITEALDCINHLGSEFEDTDNGLWQGIKSIEEIINAKATYTLINAISYYLQERIKDEVKSKLNAD